MKGKETKVPQEPVGIVIAVSPTPPRGTVFSAYVWGPAPKKSEKESK